MINLVSVKCPECGANLSIEDNRKTAFCTYCGAKVLINNENEYTFRHIDEAEIKYAEADREIRLRELGFKEAQWRRQQQIEDARLHQEESRRKSAKSLRVVLTIIWSVLLVVLVFTFIIGVAGSSIVAFAAFDIGVPIIIFGAILIFKTLPDKETERINMQNGGIRFPKGLDPFTEKHYMLIYKALRNSGFENITCINLYDIRWGFSKNLNKVKTITVNGKEIISGGRVYMPDAPIVISYHGR